MSSVDQEKKRIIEKVREVLRGKGYLSLKEIVDFVGHGDKSVEETRGTQSKSSQKTAKTQKGRIQVGNKRLIQDVIRDLRKRGVLKRKTTYTLK